MLKLFLCLTLAVLFLVGCATISSIVEPASTSMIVPESEVLTYLESLKSSPYQDLKRLGAETFRQGSYIPNHQRIFDDFPAQELPEGQIRYDLLLIEGEAGMAWIYLFLKKDSGQIIEFSAGEATF